jgi:hypothetical protein
MEDRISVVFSSKKKAEENKEFIEHIKNTCGCEVYIVCVYNPNGLSLSRIYADILETNEVKDKITVFIHDDIEFLKGGWGKEILRLFNEHEDYGIIGVAGSAQFDANAAWWNYEKKFGQVLHRNEGNSWLTAFSPLLDHDLEEVCVIDGLFMAIHRDRVKHNFSKTLEGFDFYDVCLCLANYIEGGSKIGVTTNIRLAHNSVGKLKDTWYQNREIINKAFGQYYPIEVGKKKKGKK